MIDQKTTEIRLSPEAIEFLDGVAADTNTKREDMLEYSVRLLQTVMDWRSKSPSKDDLDPKSVEDDLIGVLQLALKIEGVGGADRIVLESPPGQPRYAITTEGVLSRNRSKYPRPPWVY